jgi:hypothetical protein
VSVPNTSPTFPSTFVLGSARISSANTARDGSGLLTDVITGDDNGTRVDRIVVTALGTTTAGMVRLFLDDGTNIRAFKEVPVTAVMVGASTAAFTAEVVRTDGLPVVNLPAGHTLRASTHNAESFDVVCHAGSQ